MECYECAKSTSRTAAVALCPECSAGLCLSHVREAAARTRADGSRIGCVHDTWQAVALAEVTVPAGMAVPAGA